MKAILFLAAALTLVFTGCSSDAGVSVGHHGHSHGASMGGSAGSGGVGVNAGVR